jgi:hypothetical protein
VIEIRSDHPHTPRALEDLRQAMSDHTTETLDRDTNAAISPHERSQTRLTGHYRDLVRTDDHYKDPAMSVPIR